MNGWIVAFLRRSVWPFIDGWRHQKPATLKETKEGWRRKSHQMKERSSRSPTICYNTHRTRKTDMHHTSRTHARTSHPHNHVRMNKKKLLIGGRCIKFYPWQLVLWMRCQRKKVLPGSPFFPPLLTHGRRPEPASDRRSFGRGKGLTTTNTQNTRIYTEYEYRRISPLDLPFLHVARILPRTLLLLSCITNPRRRRPFAHIT